MQEIRGNVKRKRLMTETDVRKFRPKEQRYSVCDSDGLYLEIRPNGTKCWIYRKQGAGGLKRVLGQYPAMSLYAARKARDMMAQEVHVQHVEQVRREATPYFHELAAQWLERRCIPTTTEKNVQKQRARLARYVNPAIGNKYPADIAPLDVLAIARDIQNAGYIDLAHDVVQLVSMILRYGVASGTAPRDVTADLRGALEPSNARHRPALTRPAEIAQFMRLVSGLIEGPAKWLLLFNIYTFVRPGEARRAEWCEIDLDKARWNIPAGKMKRRRPHIVPLSTQVLALLDKARAYVDIEQSRYCFPSTWQKDKAFSDAALMLILLKLGYTREQISIHGFRSMASTTLNEHGWPPDAIELQLAHVEGNTVRAAYNYAQLLDVRARMVQWYADYLDALRDGTPEPVPSF